VNRSEHDTPPRLHITTVTESDHTASGCATQLLQALR
jgi:hypothetical protein